MDLDYGRKFDVVELQKARKGAKTVMEMEMYDLLIHKIKKETEQVSALRQKLILATRAKDYSTVKKVQHLIQMVKMSATYGKSWGNQKGNKITL
jgi:hypothetical protein